MKTKQIILPGGSGFIGTSLAQRFADIGYEVHILSRRPQESGHERVHFVHWDGKTLGDWQTLFEGADAVINLAGRSVDCRYNDSNKRDILASRLDSTRVVGKAIQATTVKPGVWMNAASATIYPDTRGDTPANTEVNGQAGNDFSMTVCRDWESAFSNVPTPGTRKLLLRMSIVLGRTGGAFVPLARMARFGLGGTMGDGSQYVSWIHLDDLLSSILFLLKEPTAAGVYNCAGPNPVTNRELMESFRNSAGCRWGLPAPAWLLEVGAFFIRTETELLLKSRKVVPQRLLNEGFTFKYEQLAKAVDDLFLTDQTRDTPHGRTDSVTGAPTRKETAE